MSRGRRALSSFVPAAASATAAVQVTAVAAVWLLLLAGLHFLPCPDHAWSVQIGLALRPWLTFWAAGFEPGACMPVQVQGLRVLASALWSSAEGQPLLSAHL